ncbi:MAG: hypothetical protein AAFP04_06135 [Myxococcota bacterium]
MFGTWRGIGIFAAACLVVGIGFGSLFTGPGPTVFEPRGTEPSRDPCDFPPELDGPACMGSGSTLTVRTPGELGCEVLVGGARIGIAPLFRQPAPAGRCSISIRCESGRRYCEAAMLRASTHRLLTVEPTAWNGR